MCDIDRFKHINDTHGHAVGDEVIKAMGKILQTISIESDAVGRYGGEEFCVLLPRKTIERAFEFAEQCRQIIEAHSYAGVRFTASFGVSSLAAGGALDYQELISQADKALYVAKDSGRNRVIRWDDASADCERKPNTNATRVSKRGSAG
jgi:diguanylate cyclase (GGDEF)-like protein